MKTIGIIGGAGPVAGTLLTKQIIQSFQTNYGYIDDYDFPKIILYSYPFAEMLRPNSGLQKDSEVARQLKDAVDFLIKSDAETIGIACNTLHSYLDDVYSEKIVNMVAITKSYLKKRKANTFILCTRTSAQNNLYDNSSCFFPDQEGQKYIDQLIRKVLSGFFSYRENNELQDYLIAEIKKNPLINNVLLGCSELSVLHDHSPIDIAGITMIDPLKLLGDTICSNLSIEIT